MTLPGRQLWGAPQASGPYRAIVVTTGHRRPDRHPGTAHQLPARREPPRPEPRPAPGHRERLRQDMGPRPARRTRDQREACELARSRAASRGWAPPQAWDDAQIDQPDGRPSPDWKPRNRTTRRAVDIVEDAQFVRDHGGYRDADNTQIAMRLGVSRDQLDQAYCRARRYATRGATADAEAEPFLHGQASAQAEPREAEP